jgi:hypothetical protein
MHYMTKSEIPEGSLVGFDNKSMRIVMVKSNEIFSDLAARGCLIMNTSKFYKKGDIVEIDETPARIEKKREVVKTLERLSEVENKASGAAKSRIRRHISESMINLNRS